MQISSPSSKSYNNSPINIPFLKPDPNSQSFSHKIPLLPLFSKYKTKYITILFFKFKLKSLFNSYSLLIKQLSAFILILS
jgi:hypothetical protein